MASAALWSACAVGDFNSEDFPCPCTEGFVCDTAANRCVRAFTQPDASTPDADVPTSSMEDGGAVDLGFETSDAGFDTSCSKALMGSAFCDGFEVPDLSGWSGVMMNTGPRGRPSVVERQTELVYRGAGALRARLGAGSVQAAVFADVYPLGAPPEAWFRGYFYLPRDRSNQTEYIGVSDAVYRESIVGSVDEFESDIHSHNYERGNFYQTFDAVFPRDRWVCVEMFVRTATVGTVALYWDSELIQERTFDTRMRDGLTRLNVGFVDWRVQPRDAEREVFVDEVAVDASRVPCDGREGDQ